MSRGVPWRPHGMPRVNVVTYSSVSGETSLSTRTKPGAMQLTVMRALASSSASTFVNMATAALDALEWAAAGRPLAEAPEELATVLPGGRGATIGGAAARYLGG